MVRGYGSCLVPLVSGAHVVDVDMYTPVASSLLNSLAAWFWGNPPEVRSRVSGAPTLFINITD